MKLLPPPGPERRRQVIRLVLLLVVLAGLAMYWRTPTEPRPASGTRASRSGTNEPLPLPDPLKLRTLESVRALPETVRNPFVFGQRQVPSAPGSNFVTVPQPWPSTLPPPIPPQEPQGPPPILLRLTGMTVAVAGGRTLVTLKDPATGALYQAYEGDIVDGRYRVVKVGVQSAVVSYLDGSGMRTLALGN